ncbi:hypothetical protein [Arthrobacter crystallopoietes]|uniref:hypothetical protein n=1 Tax=Crystallibacter crystallopoietes TaxID=37928 RepID=UPI001113B4C7|nr:hypothetical protein [Arthrobacter crystallopoietes]
MIPLTPHEVEQLVALRTALEDALSRAKAANRYRRGTAIVALDAVVERVSSLVAVTRGVAPTKGTLDDLISRLVQSIGPAWKPTVLPDIRHLRRARNASQHEGLEPDRVQVPLWASATELYVSTLIDAQFSIDIRRVVLSDAIQDASLRDHIRQAELERNLGNYASCVKHAERAYRTALTRWKQLRGNRGHWRRPQPTTSETFDRKSHDYLSRQLNEVQAVLDTLAFSIDAAEVEWFLSTIAEQGDVLNAEDSERALSFAYEWIIEYERATQSWTPNRRHRADVEARLVRSADGPAHIEDCVKVDLQSERVRAVFRIADVPDELEYPTWAQTVREILPANSHENDYWWSVSNSGTVEIEKKAERTVDFSTEIDKLSSALQEAHGVLKENLQATSEKEEAKQQRHTKFAKSIENIRHDFPDWVMHLEWSNGSPAPDGTQQMILTVSDEVKNLRFGERTEGSFFDDRKQLTDVIRDHELVTQCYGLGEANEWGLMPVLEAPQLMRMLQETDLIVRNQLEVIERREEELGAAIASAKGSIAAKLINLQ